MTRIYFCLLAVLLATTSCTKESVPDPANDGPNLVFKFKFDSTQQRLNNIGQPAAMPAGNAGQSPVFNVMSAHYIELAPTALTQLGQGAVLYKAAETNVGGDRAIDFEKATIAGNGEVFFKMPIKNVTAGNYEWLRVSLAYQNYDVRFRVDTTISGFPINQENTATVSSFIGYNNYVKSFNINNQTMAVNGNRKQGFWAFETSISGFSRVDSGQAPAGATTVVNPLAASSPIPAGSCVVTAKFQQGVLNITGKETKDVVVEVSLSTNKSFEWKDLIRNDKWEPLKGEQVVDMGIRGMIPSIQ